MGSTTRRTVQFSDLESITSALLQMDEWSKERPIEYYDGTLTDLRVSVELAVGPYMDVWYDNTHGYILVPVRQRGNA